MIKPTAAELLDKVVPASMAGDGMLPVHRPTWYTLLEPPTEQAVDSPGTFVTTLTPPFTILGSRFMRSLELSFQSRNQPFLVAKSTARELTR